MKTKLKLTQINSLVFSIQVPDRLNNLVASCVTIEFRDGEYMYIPRKMTFLRDTRLTVDELEGIVEKLKELNNI